MPVHTESALGSWAPIRDLAHKVYILEDAKLGFLEETFPDPSLLPSGKYGILQSQQRDHKEEDVLHDRNNGR